MPILIFPNILKQVSGVVTVLGKDRGEILVNPQVVVKVMEDPKYSCGLENGILGLMKMMSTEPKECPVHPSPPTKSWLQLHGMHILAVGKNWRAIVQDYCSNFDPSCVHYTDLEGSQLTAGSELVRDGILHECTQNCTDAADCQDVCSSVCPRGSAFNATLQL